MALDRNTVVPPPPPHCSVDSQGSSLRLTCFKVQCFKPNVKAEPLTGLSPGSKHWPPRGCLDEFPVSLLEMDPKHTLAGLWNDP